MTNIFIATLCAVLFLAACNNGHPSHPHTDTMGHSA